MLRPGCRVPVSGEQGCSQITALPPLSANPGLHATRPFTGTACEAESFFSCRKRSVVIISSGLPAGFFTGTCSGSCRSILAADAPVPAVQRRRRTANSRFGTRRKTRSVTDESSSTGSGPTACPATECPPAGCTQISGVSTLEFFPIPERDISGLPSAVADPRPMFQIFKARLCLPVTAEYIRSGT